MRAQALKTNFAINVAGALVPLAVSLVTVPIYIRHIGDARYGVLSIVWVLLGYFGFLDLGLSRAAANALARLRDAPQEDRARVLVTTLVLNLAMGLVGSLVLALTGSYLLQHVLNVPTALRPEISDAFPWIVGLFPVVMLSGVGIGALESRERFLTANLLQAGGTAFGQIMPVVLAVLISPSLSIIIPASVIARGLTVVATFLILYQDEGPWSPSHFHHTKIPTLLSYGGWITVTALINPFLVSLDQFVIGTVLGTAAVAHYMIPMNLVMRSQVFPSALSRTLFPRLSHSSPHAAHILASRAILTQSFIYSLICAPAIILAWEFFRFWISSDFADVAAPIAKILFFGAWINALAFVPFELLQSQGRPDVTGKFHAIEVLPFIFVLWYLTADFGINGAAIAWSIRCAVDASLLIYAAGMISLTLIRAVIPFSMIFLSAILAPLVQNNIWLATASATVVFSVSAIFAVILVKDIRRMLTQTVFGIVAKTRFLSKYGTKSESSC